MKLTPVQTALFTALGIAILLPIMKFIFGNKPNFLQDSLIPSIAFFLIFWLANSLLKKYGKWK